MATNTPEPRVIPNVQPNKPVPGINVTNGTVPDSATSILDALLTPYEGNVDTGVSHSGDLGGAG